MNNHNMPLNQLSTDDHSLSKRSRNQSTTEHPQQPIQRAPDFATSHHDADWNQYRQPRRPLMDPIPVPTYFNGPLNQQNPQFNQQYQYQTHQSTNQFNAPPDASYYQNSEKYHQSNQPRPQRFSNYMGNNYDPEYHLKVKTSTVKPPPKSGQTPNTTPIDPIDFQKQLKLAKQTAKLDGSDLMEQVTIPFNTEWSDCLDPIMALAGQKFMVIAEKSLKVAKKDPEPPTTSLKLTDEEFQAQIDEALAVRNPARSSK